MNENEMINWFKLCTVKGLGPRKIIRLFDYFKNIDNIWDATENELLRSRIFNELMIIQWKKLKKASTENFDKIFIDCKQNDIDIIPIISKEYPNRLKFIPNPPITLFLQGKKKLINTKKVAMVGSRQSDAQSKKWSFEQARELVTNNITVVSGGAIGIDYEAHRGALDASGKTICIMGPGLLNLYPKEHIPLFDEIRQKGLLISEHLPNFPGSKIALLQRNRITSGLSDAIISTTASISGGVMTQLRHANEQKIPIFCPKQSFGFKPQEGLRQVKQKYNITEIENVAPILETVEKNRLPHLTSLQSKLD